MEINQQVPFRLALNANAALEEQRHSQSKLSSGKKIVYNVGGESTLNIADLAKIIAKKPKILELLKTLPVSLAKPAIIAPTIITDEIALVTDIKGVCRDGVTLQTT